jgi:transmembrane sensor
MNKPTNLNAARQARLITEQAAAWYIEQRDSPTERQQAAFLAWLRASPAHVAEYLAIAGTHGVLTTGASMGTRSADAWVERARQDSPVVMFPRVSSMAARESLALPSRRRRQVRRFAVAAAVAVVASIALLAGTRWQAPAGATSQAYAAAPDHVREVRLADGTLVRIDRNSSIEVHFDKHERRIEVIRGHALFDVGKDAARPMLVSVGDHVLQDIGTVFDVRRDATGDTLTVINGRVRVLSASRASPGEARSVDGDAHMRPNAVADLVAGQQVEMHAVDVGPVHVGHIEQVTAWLPSDIRFQHESIGDVARRFNAYTTKPLVIEDPRIAAMRISGVFHANNPETFITYLSTLDNVGIVREDARVRVVAMANRSSTRDQRL